MSLMVEQARPAAHVPNVQRADRPVGALPRAPALARHLADRCRCNRARPDAAGRVRRFQGVLVHIMLEVSLCCQGLNQCNCVILHRKQAESSWINPANKDGAVRSYGCGIAFVQTGTSCGA